MEIKEKKTGVRDKRGKVVQVKEEEKNKEGRRTEGRNKPEDLENGRIKVKQMRYEWKDQEKGDKRETRRKCKRKMNPEVMKIVRR